jgi:hypothetical protein
MMAELGNLYADLGVLLYVVFIIADVSNFLIISIPIFISSMSHKD